MPELTWPGKRLTESTPASLITEAVVFPRGKGYPSDQPRNRLVQGDNLAVMRSLLPEYEGKIDLIYADPPFFTNRKFNARIGRGEDSRKPEQWKLAEGYHDNWDGLDAYLQFLYERLALMTRLLAPNGTLYLHLDWHADSYARLLLDELLGPENLLNEIIWTYHGPSPIRTAFNRKHDTILAYVKGPNYTFNADAVAARLHKERTHYPTKKPESYLERIILASSNPGDLVADFFCGSGTTPLVAARTGRRFLAADETFRAIHTTRKRLADMDASFTLERASAPSMHFASTTIRRASETTFDLRLSDESIHLGNSADVDYWEADPDWHGKIFLSADQAVRPLRHGMIRSILNIKPGHRVCVRLVTTKGQQFQVELN